MDKGRIYWLAAVLGEVVVVLVVEAVVHKQIIICCINGTNTV